MQLRAAITEGTRSNDLGARLTSSRGIAFDMSRAREAHQWSSGYPGLYHEAPSLIDGSQTVRLIPVLHRRSAFKLVWSISNYRTHRDLEG